MHTNKLDGLLRTFGGGDQLTVDHQAEAGSRAVGEEARSPAISHASPLMAKAANVFCGCRHHCCVPPLLAAGARRRRRPGDITDGGGGSANESPR